MNLKGEIWKAVYSTIGETSSKIICTCIKSVNNRYKATEVVNKFHRLHANIPMFALIGDNMTNIYTDHCSFRPKNLYTYKCYCL